MTKHSEKEATVRDWEERWSSVKNWFTPPEGKKPYTLGTKHVYIRYLKRWCRITGLNPDQLAAVEDIDKTRGVIAEILHEEEGVPIRSLLYKLHPLNSFWAANGREITDPYGGIREDILFKILRSKKLNPEEIKKRLSRLGKERKPKS